MADIHASEAGKFFTKQASADWQNANLIPAASLPAQEVLPAEISVDFDAWLKKRLKGEEGSAASGYGSDVVLLADAGALAAGADAAAAGSGASASAGAIAAPSASVAAATTLSTATSLAGLGQVATVGGGVALAGAAAGGGGGSGGAGGSGTPPAPPPSNPYPGNGPGTLDLSGTAGTVHRLAVDGTALPASILNKSLVIDLGANSGSLNGTLYLTQKAGGEVTTHVTGYANVQNVVGTAVNDQITGNTGANVLDGRAGDDIIYGAGGNDTLRGGDGTDWVLFKPLTRAFGNSPYNDGVVIDLDTGTYSSSQTGGAPAEASGFENVVGSDGNDRITGNGGDNILDGAGGDDILLGGGGNDQLFGGTSVAVGNQMTGGSGQDTFWVGYDINPVSRALNIAGTTETVSAPGLFDLTNQTGVVAVQNASVIHDWAGGDGGDTLHVSNTATAIIGGLYGVTGWAGDDAVDLRARVDNNGLIKIAAGAGNNLIYTSNGADQVWTGYEYVAVNGVIDGSVGPTASAAATDAIWGWDDQSAHRDQLTVALGSTAVIAALAGHADWNGNDTVDLRQQVSNSGTVIVSTGAGTNTVYGSTGTDSFYGSSAAGAYNQTWGNGGADAYYVGYNREASTGAVNAAGSTDILWDWNGVSDTLDVSINGTAIIAGLAGPVDWSGANTINLSGNQVTNAGVIVVALGDGNDTFTGSKGAEHIYGGASTGAGNQLTGGDGADSFLVGYNFNPVVGALNEASGRSELLAQQTGLDVIRDWQNDADSMVIGTRGVAVIGGLYGAADWTGADRVDLSGVTNNGVTHIAAGAGANQIFASNGTDQIWTGYHYVPVGGVIDGSADPTASGPATDAIWGWDDQSAHRDQLHVALGSTAVIASLSGYGDWTGNDTVDLRQQVYNFALIQVASGAGSNTIFGSTGSDHFAVGYVSQSNGTITSANVAAATDTIHGWDAQAWSGSDWNSASNWNGAASGADTVYDRLTVASGSTVHIDSLAGMSAADATRWDGAQTIDLRSNVSNSGTIEVWGGTGNDVLYGSSGTDLIYGGAGVDQVWGGEGHDVFYVGYSPAWEPFGADKAESHVWDWQNGPTVGATGDALRIASGSFAVVDGLRGMDPTLTTAGRWAGNDTVDVSGDVVNNGTIVVQTGAGNDTVYGSTGVDWIDPGTGSNTLNLGGGAHADRVYVDTYQMQTQVTGFGASDKIYLDTRLLDSFKTQLGIVTPGSYGVSTSTDLSVGAGLGAGQNFNSGSFIVSQLTYESTYNGILSSYGSTPSDPDYYNNPVNGPLPYGWQSNGAWNNAAYDYAHTPSKVAVIGAGSASISIGSSLAGIPFVGPILAIPFWVTGGLMLNDGINNVQPYLNATYAAPGSAILDAGATILAAGAAPGSTGAWDNVNFLNFYNVAYSNGFVPSLEILGQQTAGNPLTGIASYVAVYNGSETFVYLVASKDSLIQNSEARLILQVNGKLSADQLVMYDGAADATYQRYFNNPITAPVFPANPSMAAADIAAVGAGKQVLILSTGTYTNDTSLNVTVNFDHLLLPTDVVRLYLNGVQVGADITGQTTNSLVAGFSGLTTDGVASLQVVVSNVQGFETQAVARVIVDHTAPQNVTVSDAQSSLTVISNEPGTLTLGSVVVDLNQAHGNQGTLTLGAQSAVTTDTLAVQDIFGQTTELGTVVQGTDGVNTITAGSSVSTYVYGFGGADTITIAGSGNTVVHGGDGDDVIVVGGTGNNTIAGESGADTINLTGHTTGSDTLLWQANASTLVSDSTVAAADTVNGFTTGTDVLVVVAAGVHDFDASRDVVAHSLAGVTALGIDLNYNGTIFDVTSAGDLNILFQGTFSTSDFQSRLSFNLTGTDAADTLAGGTGNDVFTGGLGADTFVIHAGDSIVSRYDTIMDIALTNTGGTVPHDTLQLTTPVVAADTSGTNGTDAGNLHSHAVVNGLLTFSGTDSYGAALGSYSVSLVDAVSYLQSNFTADHQTVVFQSGAGSYVYEHNVAGGDTLVALQNVTVAGLTTNPTLNAADYLFIA